MTFTVTYDGNGSDGGSPPVDVTGPYNSGATVLVLAPASLTKTGATFAYWNTSPDGGGAFHGWPQDTSFQMPAANVVLYAQWFVRTGLNNGGGTEHYAFAYDSSLANSGLEPGRTNTLISNAEADYAIMSGWFPGVAPSGPEPIPVYVTRLNRSSANNTGAVRLNPGTNDVNELRSYLVSEVTESFMQGQNKGWGFLPGSNNEESCGEGLSLFLTQQFELAQGIAGPYTAFTANGWLNSSLPGSNSASTRYVTNPDGSITDFGSRFDYVNSVLPFPGNGPGTGCSILFIYYLFHQLGFNIQRIVAAAPGYTNGVLNAIAPLRGVYQNLTGDPGDPFPAFFGLLSTAFPEDQVSSIPGSNPHDPWPLGGTPLVIAGGVIDPAAQPISDATIFLEAGFVIVPPSGTTLQLSTDANGMYATPVLPRGAYQVTASQELFLTSSASVTLVDKEVIQNFVLERTLPFTLTGRVLDTTGALIGDATVNLSGFAPVTTDAAGNYAFIHQVDPVPYTGNFTANVSAAGYVAASFNLTIPNGATETRDFVLEKLGILTGHVRASDNTVIGGASVALESNQTFTDVTGLYSLSSNAGFYAGIVKAPGFTSADFSVAILIGTTTVLDFFLVKAIPGDITGIVTDDGATPINGARVAVSRSSFVKTDASGRYTLTDILPGPVDVVVSAGSRYLPQTVLITVVAGESIEYDFALVLKVGL